MFAIVLLLFVGLLVAAAVLLVAWRAATLDLQRTEDRLHDPGTETLAYDVPEGQDPVVLTAALNHGGFESVEDTAEGMRRIIVDCPHGRLADRSRVRALIEHVHTTGLSGVEMRPPTVQFADEL
jgi:hypothetical protein